MANFCPVEERICISRGDSPVIPVVVRDTNSAAVNITGYTFTFTVDTQPSPSDDTSNLFGISGAITDAANGRVEFQPSTSQTNLAPGVYFYDIQMITATPSVRTILSGVLEVKQDITKI